MSLRYPTPKDLVQALQEGGSEARAQLWHHFRSPVGRLLDAVRASQEVTHDTELLTRNLLHTAEIYLRTRPPTQFEGQTWEEFLVEVLLYLGKVAFFGIGWSEGHSEGGQGPAELPECPAYHSRTFFLPCEKLGSVRVGGDWFGGARASDGSLWVFVADVTGHGYSAHMLASGLPHIWRVCWEGLESDCCQPVALLEAMHNMFEECLPEGVFVEGTLARLRTKGETTVAPAGGSRVLLRRGGASVAWHTLKGSWLGLVPPNASEQRNWVLSTGDELLLTSDGLFDQIGHCGEAGDPLADLFADGNGPFTLFEAAHDAIQDSLRNQPQQDDITVIVLRKTNTLVGGDAPV